MALPRNVLAKIARGGDGDCWPWAGRRNSDGYGTVKVGSRTDGTRRTALVHKLVLETKLGRALLTGMECCHACDVRHCANPAHLSEGTHAQNVADRDARDRTSRGERRPGAKLTEEKVRAIRAATGTLKGIASRFGISDTTAGAVRRLQKWRHVV